MKTIQVKGFLIQHTWDSVPQLAQSPADLACEYVITHREFSVDVPVETLRFDPVDSNRKHAIFLDKKLAALKHKHNLAKQEVDNIKKELEEFLALPSL